MDLDRISETYAELKTMYVQLDPNPIELGPKRFNNRIAQVRALLTRVDQIFLQISEDLHYYKRKINNKRTIYELEKRDLMINDPKCRVGRAQPEREALADVQLRSQIEELRELEIASIDLETLLTVVNAKRTDLKDIQSRMRDQMRLIEHDLGMGARWGDRRHDVSVDADGLDRMIQATDSKLGWTSDEERESTETAEEDADEDEVEADVSVASEPKDTPESDPQEEPVLEFSPEEEEEGEEISLSTVLLDEEPGDAPSAKGEDLPEATSSDSEVDDFLSSINDTLAPPPAGRKKVESVVDGIDDLIASLTND